MEKEYRYAALLILTLIILFFIYIYFFSNNNNNIKGFYINNHKFEFKSIATTLQEQEMGLMNTTITNDTFMLFVFKNSSYQSFWMYNTKSNLDIIWLNGSSKMAKIVYIAKNATSCITANPNSCAIYTPNNKSNYVIEAKAGFVSKYDIKLGEIVNFN